MSIGERIKQLRMEQNMSQGQLADCMQITRQAVSKWENDTAVPDALRMIQLADLLKTDLEYLATGRITKKEPAPIVVNLIKKETPPSSPPQPAQKTIVKRVTRVRYVRNPLEFAAVAAAFFTLGFLIAKLV